MLIFGLWRPENPERTCKQPANRLKDWNPGPCSCEVSLSLHRKVNNRQQSGFWFDHFPICILLVIKEGLKWGKKEVMCWFFHVRELEQSISNNMRNLSFLLEELILFNNHFCPCNHSCSFIKLHCDTAHLLPMLGVSFLQVGGIDVGVKKETAPLFEW